MEHTTFQPFALPRRTLLGVLASVFALGLAACESADRDPSPSPGPFSPSAPSPPVLASGSPAEAAEQAALAAYRGMWAAYDSAGQPPEADPDYPVLERYATGDALETLVAGLTSIRQAGLVLDGEVVYSPTVTELSPPSAPNMARVEDCADSTSAARVRADGEPFEDEPGGRRRIVADVEVVDGGIWKVTGFAVREVGSCPDQG